MEAGHHEWQSEEARQIGIDSWCLWILELPGAESILPNTMFKEINGGIKGARKKEATHCDPSYLEEE